ASTGRMSEARAESERAVEAARRFKQFGKDGVTPNIDRRIRAGILGYAGEFDAAVAELRRFLPESSWTPRGLYLEPKLLVLRGRPAFEAFAKEN
ncbi:MAG: hypothetical protein ABIQ55_04540, partial [Gemmatimonadaceae bacterium]